MPAAIRLYHDPVSSPCRSVALFAADCGLELDLIRIDLSVKEQMADWFMRLNPSHAVPVIEHDDFILTEAPAILRYLAGLTNSPAYPQGLRERARVDEMMNWFATGFSEDYVQGYCYAHVLPKYVPVNGDLPAHLGRVRPRCEERFAVLDAWLEGRPYLTGQMRTIADYYGACQVVVGDLVDFNYSSHRNVSRWVASMKTRRAWDEIHAAFYGLRSGLKAAMKMRA